jgi:hypothetical protein
MKIREFELFHGACLTRLIRRDKPTTLKLIELDSSQSWSSYKVNDTDIFIKSSSNPRTLKSGGFAWTFTFSENQINVIANGCHLILVCGSKQIKDHMEICFLEDSIVKKILKKTTKSITVTLEEGQSFRVKTSAITEKLVISRNAIDKFQTPY